VRILDDAKELFQAICNWEFTVSTRNPEVVELGLKVRRRKNRNEDTGKTDIGDCGRGGRDR